MKKKISACTNARVNIGNYQHIEFTVYAESEIEYDSKEQMVEMEDELNSDLLNNLIRNMKTASERLKKGEKEVQTVQESISKAIPEWLASNPVPNIANKAKTSNNSTVAAQKDAVDNIGATVKVEEKKAPEPVKVVEPTKVAEPTKVVEPATSILEEDLFDDEPESTVVSNVKSQPAKKDDDDDFFKGL